MSEDFERDWADCGSGPFCKHWGDPGSCDECALETTLETVVRTPYILSDQDLAILCEAVNKEIAKRKEENG